MGVEEDGFSSVPPRREGDRLSLRAPSSPPRELAIATWKPNHSAAATPPDPDALANIRHDLRSAVHAVVGFAGLLACESHGPLNLQQRSFVEHILRSSGRLEDLLESLSELSVSPGAAPPETLFPVELCTLLRHTLTSLELHNGQGPCELRLSEDLATCRVLVDPGVFRKGLGALAAAITRNHEVGARLSASLEGDVASVQLMAGRTPEEPLWIGPAPGVLLSVRALGPVVATHTFVALKLAESYLSRLGASLSVAHHCELARVTFPLYFTPSDTPT